jgi:hypothetical protein
VCVDLTRLRRSWSSWLKDAVGFVRDREIEDRPHECQAGGLAAKPARDLSSAFDYEIERLAAEDE